MKKLHLILMLLVITVAMADDTPEYQEMMEGTANQQNEATVEESSNQEVTAVSKVLERFGSLIPDAEIVEEHVEEAVVEFDSSFEVVNPIQTAKFETKEMPYLYPEGSDSYSKNSLIKKPILEKNTTQKVVASKKDTGKTLIEIEKEAKKIIALEMAKVKKVEEEALKKIEKAMKAVEEARGEEKNLKEKKIELF